MRIEPEVQLAVLDSAVPCDPFAQTALTTIRRIRSELKAEAFAGVPSSDYMALVSAAVLLDATVVRSLLVPSVLRILGRSSWYFPAALRWIPNVSIEGKPLGSLLPTSLPRPIAGAED